MSPNPPVGPVEAAWSWAESHTYLACGNSVEATTIGDWAMIVEIKGYQANIGRAQAARRARVEQFRPESVQFVLTDLVPYLACTDTRTVG